MSKAKRTALLIGAGLLAAAAVALLALLLRPRSGPGPQQPLAGANGTDAPTAEFLKVKLFFPSESSPVMRPVSREIAASTVREEMFRQFVSQLLAGEEGRTTPVPEGAELRGLYYLGTREMLVLDFGEGLGAAFPPGSSSELEFIYFWVDNLCYNFREIKKVKFLIGGNESKTLAGHIDLERPFLPDFAWLKDD